MKPADRLMTRLSLFIVPVLLALAVPFYVMGRTGELIPTQKVIELQERNDRPRLICAAYNDPWGYVKFKSAQNRGAEVLALGTSRVMMIRQTFFRTSFYNGSRGISEMKDFRTFIEALPEKARPKILLMGLDPNLLNPNWIWASSISIYEEPSPYKEWLVILGKKWVQLYWDLWTGAFELSVLSKTSPALEKIGLIAKAKDKGFLNDGSHLYQDFFIKRAAGILDPPEKRFAEFLKKARKGEDVFVPGTVISKARLDELEQFLKTARQMGIHVIGYLPPAAPMIYEILQSRKPENVFLFQLEAALRPLFNQYGFTFHDYTDPKTLSATDDEFYDGVHDTGEVSARLLKDLTQRDQHLKKVISPAISPADYISGTGTGTHSEAVKI